MIVIRTVASERLLMDEQNHSNKVKKTDNISFVLRYNGVSVIKPQILNYANMEIDNHLKDLRLSHRTLSYHDRFTLASYYSSVSSKPLLTKYASTLSAIGSDLHLFI
jgi:hypothetical protein